MKVKEVKDKSMTKEKKRKDKADIFTYYIFRPLSNVISIPFIKLGISATTVTQISVIFDIIAFILIVFVPQKEFYIIGMLCLLIWNILDHVDGTIARFTNTCSKKGELWDAVGGYLATFILFNCLGIIAFRANNLVELPMISNYAFLILGNLAAFFLLFPRLVMHKKKNLENLPSVSGISDKENFGILKIIIKNIISINGFCFVISLCSIIFDFTNICLIFYFFINFVVFFGTSKKLLF